MFLGLDAVHVNIKATKVDFPTSPGAFRTFGLDTIFCQVGKDFTDKSDAFYQSMAVNHNIVTVYNHELVSHWLQDAIFAAHELAGCIRQCKWQDSPLL